jgi:formylglycine-generating enzyme required for sulfatase activity
VLAGKEPDADANHDGYVTGTELGLFLHQKMTNLTNNRQTPRYGKLSALGYDRGDFVFQVGKPDVPTTAAVPTPQPTSEAAQAWAAAQDTTSQAVLESFIRRYGDSFYADLARARLDELEKQVAVVPPVAAPQSPNPVQNTQVAVVPPPVVPTPPAISSGPCGKVPVTVSFTSRSSQPLSAAEECALKPKDAFKECEKCPEMIVVPPGNFTMGSPSNESLRGSGEDQVRVAIAKPFAVGKFAVTFEEWDVCMADGWCGVYRPADQGWGRGRQPVINVSWDDAQTYVAWLSRKTGKTYRLLSEAEREYATRAGTTARFWWGSSITSEQANFNGVGMDKGERTVPVDSFSPNPWGLYNVHGNVWEWTQDCWNASNSGNPGDGSARTTGECMRHVVRGGSGRLPPSELRAPTVAGTPRGSGVSIWASASQGRLPPERWISPPVSA